MMKSILDQTDMIRRGSRFFLISILIGIGSSAIAPGVLAQCVDHPDQRTALRFSNESSFVLRFFIDDDEDGVAVASLDVSKEFEVTPGDHVLRARAIVKGKSFWVWAENDVPRGKLCTWTVSDPPRERSARHIHRNISVRRSTVVKQGFRVVAASG